MIITETFEELLSECKKNKQSIYEQAQAEEAFVQDLSVEYLRDVVYRNIAAMRECIKNGEKSKELSNSGLSGGDCKKLQAYFKNSPALFGKLFEKITVYALASAEENARMGKIVACPTAGSCGIVISKYKIHCVDKDGQAAGENVHDGSGFSVHLIKGTHTVVDQDNSYKQ